MLSCGMDNPDTLPANIPYRGYSLQILHKPPQYQVVIAPMLREMPELSAEKRIVRGWNEEEVVKRAKIRVDDVIG
jgi:hypothetical protein